MGSVSLAYVVEECENPSTSFFIAPFLHKMGIQARYYGFTDLPPCGAAALVIFVRYVPHAWQKWVNHNRADLSGVALFIDDDLLDARATIDMPLLYRWKIWRLSTSCYNWLRRTHVSLWVSTPYLQRKYSSWPAQLLLPSASCVGSSDGLVRIFYHGTASHAAEMAWLKQIIQSVYEKDPRIIFELVGGSNVRRDWRRFPNVIIVHPMKWATYKSYSELCNRDIGLAPLLDLPFNRSRSYTKFFDITRSNAVGIFSEHPAFHGVIDHGVNGLVATNNPDDWVCAILTLAHNSDLRNRLLFAAQRRVAELSINACDCYSGLT